MKYFFDTEFIEDGNTIDLISIGIISEDGREYYAINWDCRLECASQWVIDNVIIHLPSREHPAWKNKKDIAQDIIEFCHSEPEFWAYYADYDWVVLCQLFGTMMDLPSSFPMYCNDIKQLCNSVGNPKLQKQLTNQHHALHDARWCKQIYDYLSNYLEEIITKQQKSVEKNI
ncbi:MAG: 3'-5' exoribonuclease [Richelia sp. RM2_1_2]|nr:3'-5' exoribonuclease [Richelia sp. RM2_1_2]